MLKILPLGGLGEIGLNSTVFEHESGLVLVDAGLLFPGADAPGVEIIVPDFAYLKARARELRAIVLTHGHEDHIGAVPHLLREVQAPVYGTKLTLGLLALKLEEAGVKGDLREIHPRERISLDDELWFEPIRVAHSMPDAVGLALGSPEGTVIHTGDFKLDETPIDGQPTDMARLGELGDEGVLCLLSDSTNAEVRGETPSEAVVARTFERIFTEARGRVIVTMFASHLLRVQHVLDLCERIGRRVGLVGRSMLRNVELAAKLGTLKMKPGLVVPAEETANLAPERVVLLCTGAQAEPRAALAQLLTDQRGLAIRRGDTVLFSARAIPGNDRSVTGLIDSLIAHGARVLYPSIEPEIHVSGHASSAQQRRVLEAVRPRNFIPIHGELHHLSRHAEIAEAAGVEPNAIHRIMDGDVLGLSQGKQGRVLERVAVGRRFTSRGDGVDIGLEALEERVLIGQVGVVGAALVLDSGNGRYLRGPILSGKGLALEESNALGQVATAARAMLEELSPAIRGDVPRLREELTRTVRRAFQQTLGRRPTVIPLVIVV